MYNIQTKISMLLFKINSHKMKYFDGFFERLFVSCDVCRLIDRFSLSHSHTDFIALVPPSVERNKVCIRDYTWTAFSSTISRNLVPGFCGLKQMLWTSNGFYIKFGEIITYHVIGIVIIVARK